MRVEIRSGGDGIECWNRDAIAAYADEINEREGHLRQRNPDLVVLPGRIACYGCEVQEYGYGTKCTAQISKTMFTIQGEIQPRPADAVGWHREIPGLATICPEDTRSTRPEVTESTRPEVTESTRPEVTESTRPEVTESTRPEVTESPRPEVTESAQGVSQPTAPQQGSTPPEAPAPTGRAARRGLFHRS